MLGTPLDALGQPAELIAGARQQAGLGVGRRLLDALQRPLQAGRGLRQMLVDGLELALGAGLHRLAGAAVLFCDLFHDPGHHRRNGLTGETAAGREAALEGARHRIGQRLVALAHRVVELLLVVLQAVIEVAAHALHLRGELCQALRHRGQGLGLLLQGAIGLLAVEGQRVLAQLAAGHPVQVAAGEHPLAPHQGGHQAQHGGGGNARHRGAEGHAEALDRGGRCENNLTVGQVGR